MHAAMESESGFDMIWSVLLASGRFPIGPATAPQAVFPAAATPGATKATNNLSWQMQQKLVYGKRASLEKDGTRERPRTTRRTTPGLLSD